MKKQRVWLFLFLILAGGILLSIKPIMEYRSQRLNEIKQAASMMVISEAPNETVISSIANKNDQANTDIEPRSNWYKVRTKVSANVDKSSNRS